MLYRDYPRIPHISSRCYDVMIVDVDVYYATNSTTAGECILVRVRSVTIVIAGIRNADTDTTVTGCWKSKNCVVTVKFRFYRSDTIPVRTKFSSRTGAFAVDWLKMA